MRSTCYYLGWRDDPSDPTQHKFTANIVDGRQPIHTTGEVGRCFRLDHCSIAVSNGHYAGKNRTARSPEDDLVFDMPYCVNGVHKHIKIYPHDKPHTFECLVSWILDHSIDFNYITEDDEFTLMMLT